MLATRSQPTRIDWRVPGALIALSIVPVLAGGTRLAQLASSAPAIGDSARFSASPTPVVLHIIAASIFGVLGALQFVPQLRSRGTRWHRTAGRLVLPSGFVVALTGLWMTQFYAAIASDSTLLYATRLVVGGAMLAALSMAIFALKRRAFDAHGDWMIRAYALGMGAGTQVLTHLPWVLLIGTPGPTSRALLMGAGWAINIAVAEWTIKRGSGRLLPAHHVEQVPAC